MAPPPTDAYTIIHLPAGDIGWAGVLTQFTLILAAREGKSFAAWAGERLLRATKKSDGLVALADGQLLGMLLFETLDDAAELTLPWTREPLPAVARDLALAAVQVVRNELPQVRYIRAERQLLPGEALPTGLDAAGFDCHWRWRMALELDNWRDQAEAPPDYRITHWQIAYLDAAANVVYRANEGTLDAALYAPFFGDSPAQCRKGLLAILVGRYGRIHPQATLCAFHGDTLAGINLVISENDRLASIVELSVDPAHQRRGLGRTLMVHSLRVLKHEHCERVELAVTKDNARAVHLYESLGFITFGDFPVCVLRDE